MLCARSRLCCKLAGCLVFIALQICWARGIHGREGSCVKFTEQTPRALEQDCAFQGKELFEYQFPAYYLALVKTTQPTTGNQVTRWLREAALAISCPKTAFQMTQFYRISKSPLVCCLFLNTCPKEISCMSTVHKSQRNRVLCLFLWKTQSC